MIKTVSHVSFPRGLFQSVFCSGSVSTHGDSTIKTLLVRFAVKKLFEEEERERLLLENDLKNLVNI